MKAGLMRTLPTVITLVSVLVLISCESRKQGERITDRQTDCMQQALAADDTLGYVRNLRSMDTSLSAAITEYIRGLQQIGFDDCPEAFRQAYTTHAQAWENILVLTDEYPMLRGEMHELFDQIGQSGDSVAFRRGVDQIWSTWAEVEKHATAQRSIHSGRTAGRPPTTAALPIAMCSCIPVKSPI